MLSGMLLFQESVSIYIVISIEIKYWEWCDLQLNTPPLDSNSSMNIELCIVIFLF